MPYSHLDDEEGLVTTFCDRLVHELRVQMGSKDVEIFMDRDIDLGMPWEKRIAEGLAASTFLLPILTPSFLRSDYCREEVQLFLAHEQEQGRNDLILPVYYVECDGFLSTTTDERVAATWDLLASRQHFKWWHLRHKDPSKENVREERTELAKQIQRAMARRRPQSPAPEPELQPEPVSTEAPAPAQESLHLDDLFDPDPVRSWPAAEEVAAGGPGAIPAILERLHGMTEPTRFVLRNLLSKFPEISAPLMVERIEAAEDEWQLVTQVPECLSTKHAVVCEDQLAILMHESSRVDVVRKAVEGLGYVGSIDRAPGVASFLEKNADKPSDYFYDKYYGYCVTALARTVRLAPMEAPHAEHVSTAFEYLEPAVRLVSSRGWQSIVYPDMQHILSRCQPHHGDRFVSQWLTSDSEDMRALGAYALGGIGLSWATPMLLERCEDSAESIAVRKKAAFAAGVIGGAEALERLGALDPGDEQLAAIRDDALTICIGDAGDDTQFRELAQRLIARTPSELCWVYRAIGRRGDEALRDLVRDGLGVEETSVRGDAALALARLSGRGEGDALRRAREQASSTRESLLASLALLTIDEELPGSSHPSAASIAEAWAPIYETSSAY
jgi:hypothetical protein